MFQILIRRNKSAPPGFGATTAKDYDDDYDDNDENNEDNCYFST